MNTLHPILTQTLHRVAMTLTLATAAVAGAHADTSAAAAQAFIGEDSGSFYLSRKIAASSRPRADVQAELAAARTRGDAATWIGEDSGSFALGRMASTGDLSRADVRAEVMRARERGELGAMTGEDSGSFHLARAHADDTATATREAPRPVDDVLPQALARREVGSL